MEAWISKDSDGTIKIWNKCPNYDERHGVWFCTSQESIEVTDIELFNKSLKRGERVRIWRLW